MNNKIYFIVIDWPLDSQKNKEIRYYNTEYDIPRMIRDIVALKNGGFYFGVYEGSKVVEYDLQQNITL